MIDRRLVLGGGVAAALAGCGQSKFRTYDGPAVTRIQVMKGRRRMFLLNDRAVLRDYPIHLGFAAEGHKQFKGDGRTPEGAYLIDRQNPRSAFHLSLGVSYPNARDRAFAKRHGRDPGGDIFIHGDRRPQDPPGPDWTAGCIAVTNREIEEIYAMVPVGTPIDIFA